MNHPPGAWDNLPPDQAAVQVYQARLRYEVMTGRVAVRFRFKTSDLPAFAAALTGRPRQFADLPSPPFPPRCGDPMQTQRN